jgi:ferrous iron transport protein B
MQPSDSVPSSIHSIALIGNPNTGKTTLFNALTGLRQHVGNYPGVTVERKTGAAQLDARTSVEVVDLPGTYSLAARSPDEMIAVDVLLGLASGSARPDAVLAITDASNPERSFYLVSQLCELQLPLVVALNMTDLAERQGIHIDAARLAAALGVPVVPICASSGRGLPQLRETLVQAMTVKRVPATRGPEFPPGMRTEVEGLHASLRSHASRLGREVSYVEALRVLVDAGGAAERRLDAVLQDGFQADLVARRRRTGECSLVAVEVQSRYAWVKAILGDAVSRPAQPRATPTESIDRVLLHWLAGPVVFLGVMAVLFQSVFRWAEPLMDLINGCFAWLAATVGSWLAPGALRGLLCDGVLSGVGGVLVFLPQIAILFLFIAILEDCGYMARAAFLMDRLLAFAGLSGKSFIPMLSGFACGVPAVMATRTIENPRDRLATILVTPLMSCSARIPVYMLMIAAFIPPTTIAGGWVSLQGVTLLALYLLGLVTAVPVAWLLKKTLLRGEKAHFLMELPSYQWPSWRSVALRVWDRTVAFVVRAGTIILAVSIVVWALSYFPHPPEIAARYETERTALASDSLPGEEREAALAALDQAEAGDYLRQSAFGRMGRVAEPVFRPLGWDWRISMGALASFPAREVIVATVGTIFNLGDLEDGDMDSRQQALRAVTWDNSDRPLFTIPVALSIMVFFALCCQCAATLATIKRETNTWRWPIFAFSYMTVLAYVGAFATFQLTTWLGWGAV